MVETLIRGAYVVPCGGRSEIPGGDILIRDGTIVAVGPGLAASAGATVIEAAGLVATPGFIDAHRHVWQAPLRGAFRGALAVRAAAQECGVTVLEPIDDVVVRLPDDHLGAVLGDLSGRHGRVLGTEPAGPGRVEVRAEVPAASLLRYAVDLRALTSGAATFTRRYAHHDVVPPG